MNPILFNTIVYLESEGGEVDFKEFFDAILVKMETRVKGTPYVYGRMEPVKPNIWWANSLFFVLKEGVVCINSHLPEHKDSPIYQFKLKFYQEIIKEVLRSAQCNKIVKRFYNTLANYAKYLHNNDIFLTQRPVLNIFVPSIYILVPGLQKSFPHCQFWRNLNSLFLWPWSLSNQRKVLLQGIHWKFI